MRNLFAMAILAGIYSLLSAGIFTVLDAVDVAFTEAAVGAGISTVLMLATLSLVGWEANVPVRRPLLPLVVVLITGGILIYGTLDMPPFGDPGNPIHHHVVPRYIETSPREVGPPNIVTSVLASYRGYDTMGETTVVFTAAVGVLLLLGRFRKVSRQTTPPAETGPQTPAGSPPEGASSGAPGSRPAAGSLEGEGSP